MMPRAAGLRPALAALLAIVLSPIATGTALAQAPNTQAVAAQALPAVPTTRILAIGHVTPRWTAETMRTVMPNEVRETVTLYLAGKLDQWFVRKDRGGVVFLFNTSDIDEVRRTLDDLPLGKTGLMDFELIPLGPLAPLGLLLGPPKP